MLKIDLSDNDLQQHSNEIQSYFNLYVGALADEFSTPCFRLKRETGPDKHTMYKARFQSNRRAGRAIEVEIKSKQAKAAIELCFARARRTLLREHRIAALG